MLNQTFPIVYRDARYFVDPSYLTKSSIKFHELINPFIQNGYDIETLHLRINYDGFTERNIRNFLKLCQNQQTDVMNSEIKEICLIAKMFQADTIYNTGVTFIKETVDPNFDIPKELFADSKDIYLLIEFDEEETPKIPEQTAQQEKPVESTESTTASICHVHDLNDLEFDESEDSESSDKNNNLKHQTQNSDKNNKEENKHKKKKLHSTFYTIKVEKPLMKCKRYIFLKDGKVIFSAKRKDNEIAISEGDNVRIRNGHLHSARITQNREGFNIITMKDQEFKISYVPFGSNKKYSMKFTFHHKNSELTWSPKVPKYATSFYGEYAHIPVQSTKNIILQNSLGHPTYILRKMNKMSYEAECHPGVSPLTVFAISISQIIGPYGQ